MSFNPELVINKGVLFLQVFNQAVQKTNKKADEDR